jgi:hypothetical protein
MPPNGTFYDIKLFTSGWSPLQGTETRKFVHTRTGSDDPTGRRLRVDEFLELQDDGSKIPFRVGIRQSDG